MFITWILIALQWLAIYEVDQPQFKGGEKSLAAFLVNNQIYPEYSKFNCIQGTIQVRFKLNNRGKVYESDVQRGLGVDLDDEALRLIRLTSGKWMVPANHDTTQAIVLPVNFSLKEFNCEQRSRDDINEAITAYRTRKNLTRAVVNFYEKKSAGQNMVADEAKILELKAQLGYDDKYIDRSLKQAQRKLKQRDSEGACEDLIFIKNLGSNKADELIRKNCR
ncbi:MAG TPA: TonB family protein [Sphingobacteriaceae bacterium]|nr:TonB family protein [Sphingobacteriaceae bacterium]